MGLPSQDKRVRSDVVQLTSSSQIGVLEEALGNELDGWSKGVGGGGGRHYWPVSLNYVDT